MDASPAIDVVPVTARNWRDCVALRTAPGQEDMVSPVAYSLCLCAYGPDWKPWAITRDDRVVGFAMTATDDNGSRWIGGVTVDASVQRCGIARTALTQLRDQLAAEPDCPGVALSYAITNTGARELYAALGFHETGETEADGTEVVARWTPLNTR